MLIKYAEVVVPVIYSLYVLAACNLANRPYYSQLMSLDAHEFQRTISNVLVYSAIELLSFLLMTYTLRHKLGIVTFRQLAFVLEKQWRLVQSKLVLWFFYTVQTSLYHSGTCMGASSIAYVLYPSRGLIGMRSRPPIFGSVQERTLASSSCGLRNTSSVLLCAR